MEVTQEIVVTSCLNDSAVSAYVWDVHTGTSLMTYRGDTSVTPAGLSLLSSQYVVAALQDKPFLRVWPVNSQQPLNVPRLVCAGRVTHAQASPDNCYVAVIVAEKLHVYQVASGRLVGTGARHFQPIRVVRWSLDGSLVVCGGEDGLVTVWALAAVQVAWEPRYVLSDHTLPVTDLVVTGGSRPHLLSVSVDRTCKIYNLVGGILLVSLVFDKMLTAVTSSTLETDVFVGTDSGAICQFSLLSPPRHLEYHLTAEEAAPVFIGHIKAVRSLSTSVTGTLLMSGSADCSVRLWHIGSHQCLHTFAHKGPVTNAFFAPKPKQMFNNELKPSVILNSFQTANSELSDCIEVVTEQTLTLCNNRLQEKHPPPASGSSDERLKSLQIEVDLLRSINSNLYKFTVDKIIAGNTFLPHVPKVEMELAKKNKKKVITKAKKLVDKNKQNINVTVNGMSNTKKKKRKKNKKSENKILIRE